MAMVNVVSHNSCISVDLLAQAPKVGSHLALVLHSVKWTRWTLAMAVPWWQHHKHWHWCYYYYYYTPRPKISSPLL